MGVYVVQADVDVWGFPPQGWDFKYIPVIFALDRDGKPTEDMIDGGAWGDNIPQNMAPPLKAFFEGIND